MNLQSLIGEVCQEDELGVMAMVSQYFRFPYAVGYLQTSNPPSTSSLGHDITAPTFDNGVFERI